LKKNHNLTGQLRKVIVILLLGLLLFNWAGYRLLTAWLEQSSNALQDAQLDDNEYEESQLIAIKIPITHLSYYANSREYERVRGQIEVGGVQYKYVKRRIYNDSLEVLCIPDQITMSFRTLNNELLKFANGLQHTGQNKKQGANSVTFSSPSQDYDLTIYPFRIGHITSTIIRIYADKPFYLSSHYAAATDHPPERAA